MGLRQISTWHKLHASETLIHVVYKWPSFIYFYACACEWHVTKMASRLLGHPVVSVYDSQRQNVLITQRAETVTASHARSQPQKNSLVIAVCIAPRSRSPETRCQSRYFTGECCGTADRNDAARSYGRTVTMTPDTWADKIESLERIYSIHDTNGSFHSCNSCKRLGISRFMSYTSEYFRLCHVSNLSVLNFEFVCSCIRVNVALPSAAPVRPVSVWPVKAVTAGRTSHGDRKPPPTPSCGACAVQGYKKLSRMPTWA